jgi:AAA family ATP:ADP antiporter
MLAERSPSMSLRAADAARSRSLSHPPSAAPDDCPALTPAERFLRLFTDVRAGEGHIALVMFANVFLLLCAYYLLKPLREGWLAIADVGDFTKTEVKAYTSFGQTLLLAGAATWYSRLVERLPRRVLITRVTLFCMANIVFFWLVQPDFLVGHVRGLGFVYYVWVGMFGAFVVAQFWAFAADLYPQEQGKRLLPMIAIGATAGAAFGSWLEGQLVAWKLVDPRLLLLAALPFLAVSLWLTRRVDGAVGGVFKQVGARPEGRVLEGRSALGMIFNSRFLLAVAVTTLLLNAVKTLGESILFGQVAELVGAQAQAAGITGEAELRSFTKLGTTAFYSGFFFWINALALFLQAFVASRLLRYGGFGALFLMLPVIALTSYASMWVLPVLWVIRSMKIVENATDYSIQNTARHVLWLPMSYEVTFKAKTTIDSLFMRAGDGLAALTVLLGHQVFSAPIRSYFAVVLWLGLAMWIVREYGRLSGDADPQGSPGRPDVGRDVEIEPRTAPAG